MKVMNFTMALLATLSISACAHRGHHGGDCCKGKTECSMEKKAECGCSGCKTDKPAEAK